MGRTKRPMEPLANSEYKNADLYKRTHDLAIFNECWRAGLRRAMLAHQEINNEVAIWRDGQVVLVPAGDVLKDLDAA